MQSLSIVTITEFRKALTPDRVRVGMIIQAALAIGPTLFFFATVAAGSFIQQKNLSAVDYDGLRTMAIISSLFLAIGYAVGYYWYGSQSGLARTYPRLSANPAMNTSPAERAVSLIRIVMIIRTALLEGPAFFGLMCLEGAVRQGALSTMPWLWIDVLPLLVLLIWVIASFPTADRLEQIFETKMARG